MRLSSTVNWVIETASDLLPHSGRSLEETLERYLHRLLEWLRADQGSIMLVDGEALSLAASAGLAPHIRQGMKTPLSAGPAGEAAVDGGPRLIQGALPAERDSARPASALVIPIRVGTRIAGVLNVGKLPGAQAFTQEDLQVLGLIAAQLAWMLSNFEMMSRMWTLAITDETTGLYNRRYFHLRLQEELQRSRRHDSPLCLVLLDLDGFKELNRTHGHLVGDEILQQVCTLVRKNMRAIDVAARYGGDELVLLLPDTGAPDAMPIIDRLRAVLGDAVFVGRDGSPVKLGFCAGIAQYPSDGQLPDELLQSADEALLQAKRTGAGSIVIAGSPE